MGYKLCKFFENRVKDTPLWGVCSTFRSNLSKNFDFGVLHPCRCTVGGEIGIESPLLHAKFHPHRWTVSPLRGEKPQNRPLSKLNAGRFALRATRAHRSTMYLDAAYCYRPSSVVCRSVSVTLVRPAKGLNRSRCRLVGDSGGPREPCVR